MDNAENSSKSVEEQGDLDEHRRQREEEESAATLLQLATLNMLMNS